MGLNRGALIFLILLIILALFFGLRNLGLAVVNTTSNITITGPNSAPEIWGFQNEYFACEGERFFTFFYANDSDGDALTGWISPQNPFFVFWLSQTIPNQNNFSIVSSLLDKEDIGGIWKGYKLYQETIFVDDDFNSTCCTDTQAVNITVIEKNNAPVAEDIGVQTIWTRGENSTFYEDWDVIDTEFDRGYGDLTYNISIVNSSGFSVSLFNISSSGVMNFTANSSTIIGTYNITICARDSGLPSPHVNISSVCGQTGGAITVCDDFTLTITDANRAPNITSYYPENLTFSVPATTGAYFNVTTEDLDGTIPDVYWYVDGALVEKDSGSNVGEFSVSWGCDSSGTAEVIVNITDGELNDTLSWNVTYTLVSCAAPVSSGGGGGGGGGARGYEDFQLDPEFITTTIYQQEGKVFEVNIKNNGNSQLDLKLTTINISDFVIIDNENLNIPVGGEKKVKLYFYALSDSAPGVYYGGILFSGTKLQKELKIVLEIKEKEPLFDLKIKVDPKTKIVNPGQSVNVFVDMLNIGLYGENVDVALVLYITDFNKIILYETAKEMIAVKTNLSLIRELFVPVTAKPGTYIVLGEVNYGNVSATTYDTFNVVEKKYTRVSYILIILIILFLLGIIIFFIYKRKKKKKYED